MIINDKKENWKKCCIYLFKNSTNPRVYIGATKNLFNRIAMHKHLSENNPYMDIHKAIYEIGWDNFEVEVLEIIEDYKLLRERENFYIKEYKSEDPIFGYNRDFNIKSNRPKKVVISSDGKEYKSIRYASQITGISDSHICSCCKGKRKTAGGFTWEYVD